MEKKSKIEPVDCPRFERERGERQNLRKRFRFTRINQLKSGDIERGRWFPTVLDSNLLISLLSMDMFRVPSPF
jgi:hypothetical protein